MGWAQIEDAIRTWVTTSTGLAAIWEHQGGPRPAVPFVSLFLGSSIPVGADYVEAQPADLDADPGEEVVLTARGVREFSVRVQAFTASVAGDASARAVLSRASVALAHARTREGFKAAGISCFDAGTVQSLPAVLSTDYEGRAVLEPRFYMHEEVEDQTGYIAAVSGTGPGGDYEIATEETP